MKKLDPALAVLLNPYRQTFGNDSGDFPETFSKIYDVKWNLEFRNSGNDPKEFPETFSRYWKKFPEKSLSYDPFLGKVSTHEIYLEKVSGICLNGLITGFCKDTEFWKGKCRATRVTKITTNQQGYL